MLSGRWTPTGVPTIYRLIEAIDKRVECLHLVFTKKSSGYSVWMASKDKQLSVSGLHSRVQVLAGVEYFPAWLGRIRSKLSEFRQLIRILYISWRFSPDLIYIDHANIWVASILARISSRRVILRLMGVYPAMRAALKGLRPAHIVLRWCYRAPYSAVICTQDGSGIEPWLDKALSSSVPRFEYLNGADSVDHVVDAQSLRQLPQNRCIVMFLGKIEYEKGAGEFVDAFLRARNLIPNQLHALIIGTGSLLGGLRSKVVACSADNEFTFIERLPHAEVATALAKSDIYVSLNRLGNLSNANLEAMRAGCCMVIPASQPNTSVDVITDQLVPSDAICRIPSVDDVESLSSMLVFLSKHPEKRKAIGNRIQERSSEFLVTWNTRVQRELELVTQLACESSQA